MKIITYFIIILACIGLTSCKRTNTNQNIDTSMGINLIDAYELAFDKTYLFNDFDKFIAEVGLPNTISIFKDTISISTKDELDKFIATAIEEESGIINLQYTGFEMGYMPDRRITPEKIDFRITNKSVQYNGSTFDQTYTIDMFKEQFAASASFPLDNTMSLFSMITNEEGNDLKHYMVLRKSKDDPFAEPTLEFTFKNGKLIYIFFANF